MARSTMANLIARVRTMLPPNSSMQFTDDVVEDALDMTRTDARYLTLLPAPTWSGTNILYLDYYTDQGLGNWEDDQTLWQFRTRAVIPSVSDNLVGHWTFASTTLPPVMLIGKTYDIWRAAADLCERWAAALALAYAFTSDGQTFNRQQATQALLSMARTYRLKSRPRNAKLIRDDITDDMPDESTPTLAAQEIDYYGSGDGN